MRYALLFSGQGMQHPTMLPWLADSALQRNMCTRLGVADWRLALQDPAWAANNAHAQVLLTGVALAAWQQLAAGLPPPAAVAGYSVGELAAFSVAGVFDASTALALAAERAAAMDRSAASVAGGMLAVTGLAAPALGRLLAQLPALLSAQPPASATANAPAHHGLALAIRNGVDSVVLGGPLAALDAAEASATRQGAHCTRLRVNIASHTPAMAAAAEAFAHTLAGVPVERPRCALFSNAADRIFSAEQARSALAAQLANTVRWDECMDNLQARQPLCVLEVGPGQALARLWNQRHPGIPARACDDFRSAEAVVAWVHAQAG